MTPLRLDTSDRQHRFPGHGKKVAAKGEGKEPRFWKPQLAGPNEHHPIVHTAFDQDLVDAGKRDLERERDVIREDQGSGTGATFAAIDRDEIDAATASHHLLGELLPEV
jgi:hypothetical protein